MELQTKKPEQEPLDIIDSCISAFTFTWINRAYILRVLFIPFLIMFTALSFTYYMKFDDSVIRQALCLLPAQFAEGWMIAQILRAVLLNQTWPVKYIKDGEFNQALFQDRSKAIKCTIIIFVLIQMAVHALWAVLEQGYGIINSVDISETRETKMGMAETLVLLFGIGLSIWAIRLTFIYIPAVANCSPMYLLKSMGTGFWPSVRLIGAFLFCSIPVQFVALMLQSLLELIFDPMLGETITDYIITLINVFFTMVIAIIINIAIAISYKNIILQGRKDAPL